MKIDFTERMDRGLAYGEACFETFRVVDGAIFDWSGHWQRLATGLREFGIELTEDDQRNLHAASLQRAAETGTNTVIRLTIGGGNAVWGLLQRGEPVASIQAVAGAADHAPIHLRLKSWPFPLREKPAKFVADYAETLRALNGEQDAAVLFEQADRLLATATANILLCRQGQWHTPQIGAGVLPGLVRSRLVEQGVAAPSNCAVAWLAEAEAVAICNSGQFIRAVATVSSAQGEFRYDARHPALQILSQALKGEPGVPTDMAI